MKAKKSKTEYLSYIEETPKQIVKINKVASTATKNARKRALESGTYVTYLDGDKIMNEYPDGRVVVVKTLEESSIPVSKDGAFRIP